jgi:hypothetical protein
MEYRTVSTKLPVIESTMFRSYCEKKGMSPANLIRELILKEMKVPLPSNVAGKNIFQYNKSQDSFSWSVKLDSGIIIKVVKNISPSFLEELKKIIAISLEERSSIIQKSRSDSFPISAYLLKGES